MDVGHYYIFIDSAAAAHRVCDNLDGSTVFTVDYFVIMERLLVSLSIWTLFLEISEISRNMSISIELCRF